MYVEPEEYQNTDNILYIKPYQLVLVAFSTRRKTHTCRFTHTSWCYQTRKQEGVLIPLVKSFVAHHRGAEPGNLRPVFIVKQQICVCFFLSNALWHSTAPAGLGHTWMMPQSKRPWRWGRALGELLLGSWTSLGRGRGGRRRRRGKAATALLSSAGSSWVCAHEQAVAEGEEQAQGMALPARLGARAQQTPHGVGQQLPCAHLLTRKGLFCSQSQRCVATGVHFPSSRWGLHRTDKVTFLFSI